jgi:hypothetical protein
MGNALVAFRMIRSSPNIAMNDSTTTPHSVPVDTRTEPLETRISRQARELWENYGRPEGRDLSIWLEAERQVLGVDSKVSQQAGGAVSAKALNSALTPKAPRASTPDGATPVAAPRGKRRAVA